MKFRSVLESLQLPIAISGGVLLTMAGLAMVSLPSPPPESEGFVHGLATVFLYVLAWVGVVVLSLGLTIPVQDGYGLTFNRYQRGLFVVAAVAAVLSGFGPFLAFGLVLSNPSMMGRTFLVLVVTALLSVAGGLLWRAGEAVVRWTSND